MANHFANDRKVSQTRKDYRCAHCRGTLKAGGAAIVTSGRDEDGFFTFRSHPECRDLWLALVNCPLGKELADPPIENADLISEVAIWDVLLTTHPAAMGRLKRG